MSSKHKKINLLYRKLISTYPKRFREKFGESMEQTFNDVYKEKQNNLYFVFWIFTETAFGIVKEYVLLLKEINMKSILMNPKSAAFISFVLALPLGLIYLIFIYDIGFLAQILNQWFTTTGNGGEINMLGRMIILGGLLLLPTSFVLNLLPMLKRDEINGTRTLHKINLFVGILILLLITFTWGGLFLESMYCAQGIRCD